MTQVSIDEEVRMIMRGVEELHSEDELREAVARCRKTGQPLKIKYGCDPSAPDIHLGHVVVLRKLLTFQQLGHTVQFLIGDFTARIGDPTGRTATRPPLSEEQIAENSATYQEQVFSILDRARTEVVYNSHWLGKMTPVEIVKLCSSYTVARMLERQDFKNRYTKNTPIRIHEFLYPLFQGYDSVVLEDDIEIGGSDQLFNIMVGRELMKDNAQKPQIALTMPILEGLDGRDKMSKSLGNYIGISDAPNEMFGKVMSIPDTLISRYFTLLTDVPLEEIRGLEMEMHWGTVNPRDIKARLGKAIVSFFYDAAQAEAAESEFRKVFAQKELPTDMPVARIPAGDLENGALPLVNLIAAAGLAASKGEARRLIRQKAVSLDGDIITGETSLVAVRPGMVLKVGKRRFATLDIS